LSETVDGPAAASRAGARRVVISGDVTMDWHLARSRTLVAAGKAWNPADRTEISGEPGGAALTAGLLREVAATLAASGVDVDLSGPGGPAGPAGRAGPIVPGDPRIHHAYAIWSAFPRRRGDRDRSIWRVEDFLGLDRARAPEAAASPGTTGAGPAQIADADLVILDDADLGCRATPAAWPAALRLSEPVNGAPAVGQQPWVVLQMAAPVASGELWRQLLRLHAGRLIVVMTLDDLRLSDVQISRELSWERIAGDLARELVRHPAINGLAYCAHVVVSLGTGGAVLLSRREPLEGRLGLLERPDCRVVFDPEAIENSWAEQYPGGMIGYTSCVVGGIARQLLLDPEQPDIERGIRTGLAAGRALHLRGYGPIDLEPGRVALAFPARDVAAELAKEPREFAVAEIVQPLTDAWSILEGRYPEGLEPVAEAIARDGVEVALQGVPLGSFGKFLTVDRGEIEGFRSIRALLREYDAQPSPRPLNIAVFGPPGAGKSFGVKAVAKSALDADRLEELTFNLSQLRDPSELADALHQVRDAGLRGRLPFVLWDEFDADLNGVSFGWLRHFLAPMQDGAFQQGQVVHPIGKAIFVFAGGTSARLADFVANDGTAFRLAKGPDFASRLKGHVDIVGPDPRGGDPEADPYYRVRRAILLRSMLLRDRPDLFDRHGRAARLRIDPGVLRAFLEVRSYRHGARSLETIVAMSTLHGQSRFERSALPAADQLDAHVDAREFRSVVERFVPEGALLDALAEVSHVEYCEEMLERGHAWGGTPEYVRDQPALARFAGLPPTLATLPALVDYAALSDNLREQNRGEARDLPEKLAILGFVLRQDAPAGAPEVRIDAADPRVERLAEREHLRWVARKVKTGWRYGDPRDDARKLHPCIRPWAELPEDERAKDRLLVLRLPDIVTAAGMTLARLDDLAPLRIGAIGHRVLAAPDLVEAGVEAAVARIEASHPGRTLVVVSSLAEGADRLVVSAVLKRPGSRLEALLPLSRFEVLDDCASVASKEDLLRLLARADEITELPAHDVRDEAYAAANERLLQGIDALVAVWDGRAAQGPGGTAEAVAGARARGLPLAWVHAGNRLPGTMDATSLGSEQGRVTFEHV
jgi:RyR domain-containing protein